MSISCLFSENDYDLYVDSLTARSLTVTGSVEIQGIVADSATVGALTTLSETQVPVERSPVAGLDCWIDLLSVPETPPPRTPWPGTASGVVTGISEVPLGQNPSDPLQFGYLWSDGPAPPYDKFSQMVPAGTSGYAYTPTLRDSLGAVIPYDPLVWVADGLRQIVAFRTHGPAYYGFTPPLEIDYWQYTGEVATVFHPANEGGGAEVFDETTSGSFRTLVGMEADGIRVTQDPTTITIDCTLVGQNLMADGPMVGNLYSVKTASAELQFRSLVAGAGVTLSQDATSVTVSSSGGGGGLSGVTNDGGGAGVYEGLSGSTALLRSLLGTANGLTVTQDATTITIDNSLTGANLGAGSQVFSAKSGASLRFRSLVAGSNIGVAQGADEITISATGVVTALANEGGEAEVYDSGTAATLRTLVGTANGLTVTQGATTITIDNSLSGANLGAGSQVFSAKSGASLQFRSLVAGSGISLSQGADEITISSSGGVPTLLDTQTFTANGTWTKPANTLFVCALLIGGGGGGGSGRRGGASFHRTGGLGGACGTTVRAYRVPISLFPNPTYAVTVGTGGAGGPGITVNSTDGDPGDPGTASSIGPLSSPGGAGGAGGPAIASTDPGLGTLYNTDGANVAAADLDYELLPTPTVMDNLVRYLQDDVANPLSSYGMNVSLGAVHAAGLSAFNQMCRPQILSATNGTPGSSINSSNTYIAPVESPSMSVPGVAFSAAPVPPTTNASGTAGTTYGTYYGYGGTGSAWQAGGPFTGGAGGLYGGGGGGGHGSTTGSTSGPGGAGADGIVVVWSFG